jgi:hypothetical protein
MKRGDASGPSPVSSRQPRSSTCGARAGSPRSREMRLRRCSRGRRGGVPVRPRRHHVSSSLPTADATCAGSATGALRSR